MQTPLPTQICNDYFETTERAIEAVRGGVGVPWLQQVPKLVLTTTFGIVCLPEGQPVGLGRVVGHGEVVGEPPEVHSVHHRGHSQALLVVAGGQATMSRGLCNTTRIKEVI